MVQRNHFADRVHLLAADNAIRRELEACASDDRDPNAWELYDLGADRSESEDLSQLYPEKLKELRLNGVHGQSHGCFWP